MKEAIELQEERINTLEGKRIIDVDAEEIKKQEQNEAIKKLYP